MSCLLILQSERDKIKNEVKNETNGGIIVLCRPEDTMWSARSRRRSSLLSSDEAKIKELLYRYTYRNLEAHELISSWLPSNVAMIFSRMMTYFQDNVIPSAELSQSDKYRLSARSGVINSILMRWIADGKKENTEEIIDYIMKFIMRL